MVGARRTRDRGCVGTIATRSTGTTRIFVQPVTGVTSGRDLVGARRTRDRGRVGTIATRSTGFARCAVALHSKCISITRNTRTSNQPVTGVTGGCNLIDDARSRVGTAIVTSVKSIQVHHTRRTHVIGATDVGVDNGGQRVRGTCGA